MAYGGCSHSGQTLCTVGEIDGGRIALQLLKRTQSVWIQKYTNNTLPDWGQL